MAAHSSDMTVEYVIAEPWENFKEQKHGLFYLLSTDDVWSLELPLCQSAQVSCDPGAVCFPLRLLSNVLRGVEI
jgi:hypothetical protein